MLSVLHRATGVALAIGLLLVSALLVSAAMGEGAFNTVMDLVRSPVGMIALIGWSFAMIYHMMNGVRHLIWDTGHLFKIEHATIAGYIVFWGAVLVTTGLWSYTILDANRLEDCNIYETNDDGTLGKVLTNRGREKDGSCSLY